MDELFHLWSLWARGRLNDGAVLWGWSVLAWGRAGKLMQYAAGLTVIIDLVGPQRLRAIGTAAASRGGRIVRGAFDTFRQPPWWLGAFIVALMLGMVIYLLLGGGLYRWVNPSTPQKLLVTIFVLIVGAASMVWSGSYQEEFVARRQRSGATRAWSYLVSYSIVLALPGALTVAALIAAALAILIPLSIVYCATWMIAHVMITRKPAHILRYLALILFLVGCHFDLLAS